MTVRFVLPDGSCVEYGYGNGARPPALGEHVVADGSDPEFPPGMYAVTHTTHHIGLRGPALTVCDVRFVYRLPDQEPTGGEQ